MAITEIELLCWKTTTEKDLQILHSFIYDATVIELEQAIKIKTAELRKAYKIKIPDAIIAATAIVHNLTLITSYSYFAIIIDLQVINPKNL
ncbi:MAG: PIN domain-containing protein [Sphingobacteriales bacterium]|nr:MAG: PIN domain-containing protein [Sphingobacteriales bacterium]